MNSEGSKNTAPLVSVLMTAYNRELYLGAAIESVLASSFQDFELIITDDCSTDKTLDIANGYARKDARVRVYGNEKNLGDYPNRNRAASYARGKYLKYLDADDLIYKYSLAYMVEAMECFPEAGLGISYNTIDDLQPYPHLFTPEQTYQTEYLGKSILGCGPSAAIVRRDVFENLNGFSGRQFLGDRELWLKIASLYNVVKLQPSLIWWRQHPDQQAQKEKRDLTIQDKRYKHALEVLNASAHFFTPDSYKKAKRTFRKNHARMILKKMVRERKLAEGIKLWRMSAINFFELISSVK